jgi:hypothetical protein
MSEFDVSNRDVLLAKLDSSRGISGVVVAIIGSTASQPLRNPVSKHSFRYEYQP